MADGALPCVSCTAAQGHPWVNKSVGPWPCSRPSGKQALVIRTNGSPQSSDRSLLLASPACSHSSHPAGCSHLKQVATPGPLHMLFSPADTLPQHGAGLAPPPIQVSAGERPSSAVGLFWGRATSSSPVRSSCVSCLPGSSPPHPTPCFLSARVLVRSLLYWSASPLRAGTLCVSCSPWAPGPHPRRVVSISADLGGRVQAWGLQVDSLLRFKGPQPKSP